MEPHIRSLTPEHFPKRYRRSAAKYNSDAIKLRNIIHELHMDSERLNINLSAVELGIANSESAKQIRKATRLFEDMEEFIKNVGLSALSSDYVHARQVIKNNPSLVNRRWASYFVDQDGRPDLHGTSIITAVQRANDELGLGIDNSQVRADFMAMRSANLIQMLGDKESDRAWMTWQGQALVEQEFGRYSWLQRKLKSAFSSVYIQLTALISVAVNIVQILIWRGGIE